MDLFLVVLTIVMGLSVGWSIGANDAANSLGAAVGARVLTLRQAILLISIFGFLGAFLQGGHVTKTIGNGIVPINDLDRDLATRVALVACFASVAWIALATYWKMPISTSHSMVGSVAGAGLAIGAPVKWKMLIDIFICWICTPLGSALLGFILCLFFMNTLHLMIPKRYMRRVLTALVVLSGCYVAYSWGANDVANATGVLAGARILSPRLSIILGGAAILIGIMTWGYKVIETVGSEITNLLPVMAFSAQLASAINVHVYTLFGIPVSTSHSIVGAIVGVGLVRGVKVLNLKIMKDMMLCWMATPFISGVISFIVLTGIMSFVKSR